MGRVGGGFAGEIDLGVICITVEVYAIFTEDIGKEKKTKKEKIT